MCDFEVGDVVEYIGGKCPDGLAECDYLIGATFRVYEVEPAGDMHCDGLVFADDPDSEFEACACTFRKLGDNPFVKGCLEAAKQPLYVEPVKIPEAA